MSSNPPEGVQARPHLINAAEQFRPGGRVAGIREHGQGNVNDTFLVTLEGAGEPRFILQRLNPRVFRRPELIMRNLGIISRHVAERLRGHTLEPGRRWETPRVLPAGDGRDHWLDPEGSFWRALSFIEAAETFDTIQNPEQAGETGYALGMFHRLLSDLPPERLAETLPGFHVTPGYLRHYDEVLEAASPKKSPEIDYCFKFVRGRRNLAPVLEDAREAGRLRPRPIHGDPKVNNVMLDTVTGKAVSLIDLDTVQPGLTHYDIGDLCRSACNPLGEETEAWERVRFDLELYRGVLQGYFSQAKDFLTQEDYAFLYEAIRLLAFELGLRFFTDYLEGNVYFKARDGEHNLRRALVQFRLTESIESQGEALKAIIGELR